MRLDAAHIANYARNAGFAHNDIVTATALALVVSGGNAGFDYRPGTVGNGHLVGLWGVDIDAHEGFATVDLHNPQTAAWAVRELTHEHDGWSWSPAWRAGHWSAYAGYAATEATRLYDLPLTPQLVTARHGGDYAHGRTQATADRANMATQHQTRSASPWRIPTP